MTLSNDIQEKIANLKTTVVNRMNAIIVAHNHDDSAHSNKQDKTDNSLNTSDKTITGAINELNQSISEGMNQDISGKEDKSNKVTSISSSSTDTQYPSAKAVYTKLENYEKVKPALDISVTGTNFSTNSSSPFTFTGKLLIDYGDGTVEEYTSGQINHTYESSGTYNVKIYGNITALNNRCFNRCTDLTSITLLDSVTRLGEDCFYRCTGLTSIDLGSSVKSLGVNCFYECTGLTSIDLGNSVTSFGGACFLSCTGLTSVTLGNNVTDLGMTCFRNCTGLTSLTIPNTITSIGLGCFIECANLTTLILKWTNSNSILTYDITKWLLGANISSFSIPNGTTELYIAKGYPSAKLIERTTYDELEDVPIVPSKTSDLQNDSGFITSHQDITGKEDKSNKVTSISSSSTDSEYPSAKSIYDSVFNEETDVLTMEFDTSIKSNFEGTCETPFTYNGDNIVIDWGDGTVEEYTEGALNHTYYDRKDKLYKIRFIGDITGINQPSLEEPPFNTPYTTSNSGGVSHPVYPDTGIVSVSIPKTITYIDMYAFGTCCYNLKIISLYWENSEINNMRIWKAPIFSENYASPNAIFIIPKGSKQNYIDMGYSNNSIRERYSLLKFLHEELGTKSYQGHKHTKSQITDLPYLSTVATTGSYNDLSNKPTIPSDVSDLTDTQNIFIQSTNIDYIDTTVTYTDGTTETVKLLKYIGE